MVLTTVTIATYPSSFIHCLIINVDKFICSSASLIHVGFEILERRNHTKLLRQFFATWLPRWFLQQVTLVGLFHPHRKIVSYNAEIDPQLPFYWQEVSPFSQVTALGFILNTDILIVFKLQIFTLQNGLQLAASGVNMQVFRGNICCCDAGLK